MSDYGADVSTFPDLDVTGNAIGGVRSIAECTLRRFMTEEASIDYDRKFGRNIRDLLNGDFTQRELRREESRLANQAEEDERIRRADVTLTLDEARHTLKLRVTGELTDSNNDFDFVLAITAVSAEVLKAD